MSDQEKHTPTYSSSDIEKYLRGELSAPEMHALERAALDDPFLADALEGMAAHRQLQGARSFSDDMGELQKRLDDRVAEKKKGFVLPLFLRYAAVVILLAGIGLTVFYMGSNKENGMVAVQAHRQTKSEAAEKSSVMPDSSRLNGVIPDATATNERASKSSAPQEKKKEDDKLASDRETEEQPAPKKMTDAPRDLASAASGVSIVSANRASANRAAADTMQLHFDTTALKASTRGYYNNAPTPLVFSGKVTDQNNHPLSGAYLSLQDNKLVNTRTDMDGNFSLRLQSPRDTTSSVAVNYVGYQQGVLSFNSDNRAGNIIQLKPQTASLNEVVVSGYGAKRREYLRKDIDAPQKPLSLVAVPANGWPAYNEYLEANKRSVLLDSTLRGNEIISFVVDKTGALSGFKVEQSISPAHDALLTRLIRQGPVWRLLSGRKERARVILTY